LDVIKVNQSKCMLCQNCISVCVRRNIKINDFSAEIIDQSRCIQCGHCVSICPTEAITLLDFDLGCFQKAPEQNQLPTYESFLSLIRNRRSIRKYKDQYINDDIMNKILEAGRYSPSSNNVQTVNYIVIRERSSIQHLRELTAKALHDYGEKIENEIISNEVSNVPLSPKTLVRKHYVRFFREVQGLISSGQDRILWNAPTVVIGHIDPMTTPFPIMDAGVAISQMVLMAETLGLGTCLVGLLVYALEESSELRKFLHVPEGNLVPISFVLGYPAVKYRKLVGRKIPKITWM
jgi:nitroreductase/NAD-dependent dihydropyrimidine dehydrogenase PreA subunit